MAAGPRDDDDLSALETFELAVSSMVFTPRVIKQVWLIMRWHGLFGNNPDAPTEETFLAHYAASGANATFAWVDRAAGWTCAYDITINQAQITPAPSGEAGRVVDATNDALWEFLPPAWLEPPADWSELWFEAARLCRVETMAFIIEQGFDVNKRDAYGDTALRHAVAPYGGCLEAVRLLLDAGAKVEDVDALIKEGADSVSSAGEYNEHCAIASLLGSVGNR